MLFLRTLFVAEGNKEKVFFFDLILYFQKGILLSEMSDEITGNPL